MQRRVLTVRADGRKTVHKRQGLTRGLALAGTALVWFPPALMAVLTARGVPGEVGWLPSFAVGAMDVFPVLVLGGGLLLGAALLARSHRRLLGWCLAAPIASIAYGVVWSQELPSSGWPLAITTGLIVVYWLGLLLAGVSGMSLVRALFSRPDS